MKIKWLVPTERFERNTSGVTAGRKYFCYFDKTKKYYTVVWDDRMIGNFPRNYKHHKVLITIIDEKV